MKTTELQLNFTAKDAIVNGVPHKNMDLKTGWLMVKARVLKAQKKDE